MIDVGQIPITDETSIVESRNKIRLFAEDLKFGSISATRIAAITSELIRKMIQTGQPSNINVQLGTKNRTFGLILRFTSEQIASTLSAEAIEAVFDNVKKYRTEDDLECIEMFKALPGPEFELSKDFIQTEKEMLMRPSRAELLNELRAKNEDLNKLLDELKVRAEKEKKLAAAAAAAAEKRRADELARANKEIETRNIQLKESQAQLIQAEKMSAVGTMVAGVAHELNNPMMGIINFAQYCLKHTSKDDKRYAVLQDTEREAKRCVAVVQNLLTFSRREKEGGEGRQKGSYADILEHVLRLLSYRIEKQRVTVIKHYAEETPEVWMRVNSIQQVFLNLLNNALDALKESEKKEIHIDIQTEGEFAQVTIADTGCGIAHENLTSIFDPFFTTKPTGEGTGLGLSISYGITEGHGGKLTCESKLGEGARFKILLPMEPRKTKR